MSCEGSCTSWPSALGLFPQPASPLNSGRCLFFLNKLTLLLTVCPWCNLLFWDTRVSDLRSALVTGSLKHFSNTKAKEMQHTFISTFKKYCLGGGRLRKQKTVLEKRASETSKHQEIMTSREHLFCRMERICARHLHSTRLKPYKIQTFLGRILIFCRR